MLTQKEILEKTEEFVKECSIDNEPGHDFNHIVRVRKMAVYLAKELGLNTFFVEMLALLHDVEDPKLNPKTTVKEFLDTLDMKDMDREAIMHILPFISYSKYPTFPDHIPLVGKIVSDADRLDAIGAMGIARAFSYGGSHHRSFEETLKHFDDKLLKLDQTLYLDKSKEIAKKRIEILREFYEEFILENNF